MGSALNLQNTRLMSIEAVDTEPREAALAKIDAMRRNGDSYKEQLAVIAGVRPVIGNIYYRCFQTADGFIAIGCLSTPLRRKLLNATGLDDWRLGKRPDEIDPTDPETLDFCAKLVRKAEALFASKTTVQWMQTLDRHGVPAGPVRYTEELLDDEQVLENGFITSVDHAMLGPVRMHAPMIQMSDTPLAAQGASPTLGQHTEDVLRDLGYDESRIASLRDTGVLGHPPG